MASILGVGIPFGVSLSPIMVVNFLHTLTRIYPMRVSLLVFAVLINSCIQTIGILYAIQVRGTLYKKVKAICTNEGRVMKRRCNGRFKGTKVICYSKTSSFPDIFSE